MTTSPDSPNDNPMDAEFPGGPFWVGDWRVDPATGEIAQGGTRVTLEPKAAEVLIYLARRPGEVVGRHELESHVWQGRVIGYDAVTNTVIKLRKAFGDDARRPHIIETLPKRGYRLVAPVRALPSPTAVKDAERRAAAESAPMRRTTRRPLWLVGMAGVLAVVIIALWVIETRRPFMPNSSKRDTLEGVRIVVLPFENLSRDADQEYFSNGLTDDLITELSGIPGLAVIANDSAFVYHGDAPLSRLREELHVDYVLRGSVRRDADRVRINVRLVEATQGQHLWAERYDKTLAGTFAVQDSIVERIATILEVSVRDPQAGALRAGHSRGIQAYDQYLRGRERYGRRTREDLQAAQQHFQRAIALDPNFARAHASLALVHLRDVMDAWSEDTAGAMQRAQTLATRATELNAALPEAHFANAVVALFQRRYQHAVAELDRAIALRPSYADGHATLAWVLHFAGRPQEGLTPLATAQQLNPHVAASYLLIDGGIAFSLGNNEEAIDKLQQALEISPTHPRILLWLAAAYARADRQEEANWIIQELKLLHPAISLSRLDDAFPFRDNQLLEELKRELRKAGLA